jgi:hypothetical protein
MHETLTFHSYTASICTCVFLQSPDKLRLLKEVREASGQYLPLDDAKKLAELKVENDDVVAMVYLKEGEQQQQQHTVVCAMQSAFQGPLCSSSRTSRGAAAVAAASVGTGASEPVQWRQQQQQQQQQKKGDHLVGL